LIDVIIIKKDNQELIATLENLGFSDHVAQILRINSGIGNMRSKTVMRRQFLKNSIKEFKNFLFRESWYEVFNHSDINSSSKAFMDIFLFYIEQHCHIRG
jgi:hypothetical protein